MQLKQYLKQLSRQSSADKDLVKDFAARCGTTVGQLRQVSRGNRRAGESLAINIERESGGDIRCEELRPDVDWGYIRGTSQETKAA